MATEHVERYLEVFESLRQRKRWSTGNEVLRFAALTLAASDVAGSEVDLEASARELADAAVGAQHAVVAAFAGEVGVGQDHLVGDDGTRLFLIFNKTAIFLSLGTLAMLVGVTFTKFLTERFDKRHLMIVLSLLIWSSPDERI